MSDVGQSYQRQGRDVKIVLSKLSATMLSDQSEPVEWNQEAINQLQEVIDGFLNSTKESTSIEDLRAALEHGDTRAFFHSKTLKLEYNYDAEFGSTQEEETPSRESDFNSYGNL
jgi:hypothetical protein